MHSGKFEDYEQKSYEYYEKDYSKKANAMYHYAEAMFGLALKDRAIDYITRGLQIHPRENIEEYVKYMLLCIGELVKNNIIELAQEVCDEALNNAIKLDSIRFIERAYYYKSKILEKQGNLIGAEMYMNLSLDALFKFGNRQEKYERYIEMGNMYHKLGHVDDSLKYFSLAMTLEKKM
jgi:tetratricopeptide (TPR) repeat protein